MQDNDGEGMGEKIREKKERLKKKKFQQIVKTDVDLSYPW